MSQHFATNDATIVVEDPTITNRATIALDSLPATAGSDLPPSYTIVDSIATKFTIYGTLIYTPASPAYQLSSLLDSCISRLCIRRLRASEITRLQNGLSHLPFDNTHILYEAHDPPFSIDEYHVRGKHRSALPGTLQVRFALKRWHVRHIPPPSDRAMISEILTCGKKGPLRHALKQRRNEMEPSEWRDMNGNVLATEVLKMQDGAKMPTIELREGLDETSREMLIALWVTRLWASFGAGTPRLQNH